MRMKVEKKTCYCRALTASRALVRAVLLVAPVLHVLRGLVRGFTCSVRASSSRIK